ncbi:MAG TPA: S41 family peptidase [Candidatus Pullilachnospira intestinigallinarum]|nr:S41 family peptidase [Candidatus Pullilachnospira intestinigallinarum]
MSDRKKTFIGGILLGVAAAFLVLCGGYYLYYGVFPFSDSAISGKTGRKAVTVQRLMEEKYLDGVDEERMADGMYAGMVASLEDPYSGYYSPDQYQNLMESAEGKYQGIGLSMMKDAETGEITVQEVYQDSPAQKAGIQAGDQLVELNGEAIGDMELEELAGRLQNGEEASLTLLRGDDREAITVTVQAAEVEMTVVTGRMLENQIGYIRISRFTEGTPEQFETLYQSLQEQGMKGLVMDLRNNPGGLLDAVCETLEQILPEGLIVYTEDKNGNRVEHTGEGNTPIQIPMAVLVNENSASAAEIFAGAVKDYQVGTLVGTTTFGKGIVQETYALEDGSAVKLTIAKYYTPSGVNIHGTGITPDVEVEWPEDQDPLESDFDFSDVPETQWLSRDPQMKKAVETVEAAMV